jgi:predicted nuclease of predicted toxin-antitoxin system
LIVTALLDQNVPPRVAEFLRSRRPEWVVLHVNDVGLRGASDDTIFRWAQAQRAIVITFDEDFADARMYPTGSHAGVVRLRVWPTTIEQTEAALGRLLDSTDDSELVGSLVIIDDRRIRIRRAARHD